MAMVFLFITSVALFVLCRSAMNASAKPAVSLRFQRYAREAQIHYPEHRNFDPSQACQIYAARIRASAGDDIAFRSRSSGSRIG